MDNLKPFVGETELKYKDPVRKTRKRLVFWILAIILISFVIFKDRNISINNNSNSWLASLSNFLGGGRPVALINDSDPMPAPETNRLDVLILGIRGTDPQSIEEEGGLLTDTIILVSVDRNTKKASMVSVPRDLYINMLGVKGKINEAYERGLEKKDGLSLIKQIVSKITGVYVDNVVIFDFNAFKDIVDRLGGVDIYLDKSFNEAKQWGYDFSLPAGQNHLDGEQALYYARSRYSTSDFDRSQRQQKIIEAIKAKAVKNGYLSNPLKLASLLSEIKNNIKTDFQIWDISDLLRLANSLNPSSGIKNYGINTTNLVYESKSAKGEYILLPKGDNYSSIKDFFKNILVD